MDSGTQRHIEKGVPMGGPWTDLIRYPTSFHKRESNEWTLVPVHPWKTPDCIGSHPWYWIITAVLLVPAVNIYIYIYTTLIRVTSLHYELQHHPHNMCFDKSSERGVDAPGNFVWAEV